MQTLITLLILFSTHTPSCRTTLNHIMPPHRPIDSILDAIRMQESGGNDRAVGDMGQAKGPYQIWRAYWRDGCERGEVLSDPRWQYNSAVWDRAKSRQVVIWYWRRYCPEALRKGNWEVLARVHNGGPAGNRNPKTMHYWKSVDKILKRHLR